MECSNKIVVQNIHKIPYNTHVRIASLSFERLSCVRIILIRINAQARWSTDMLVHVVVCVKSNSV